MLISAACQLLLRDELDFVFLKMKNEKTVFETLQFFENTGVASSASLLLRLPLIAPTASPPLFPRPLPLPLPLSRSSLIYQGILLLLLKVIDFLLFGCEIV